MLKSRNIFFIYACAGFVLFVVGLATRLIPLWVVGIALMVFALIREGSLRHPGAPMNQSDDTPD